MILTYEQTNTILEVLKNHGLYIIDVDSSSVLEGAALVSEEYFNEKVNEALGGLKNV